MKQWPIVLMLALMGCASIDPPELRFGRADGDTDGLLCRQGTGAGAIAACERVLARPDPFRWPGGSGTYLTPEVYDSRAHSARHLARHLWGAGREEDGLRAITKAIALWERYDKERPKEAPPGTLDAQAIERETATINRRLASAHYLAGSSAFWLDRWEEAVAHLRRAVQIAPDRAAPWGLLGVAANMAGRFDESTEAFATAVRLNPSYFSAPREQQLKVLEASKQRRQVEIKIRRDGKIELE